MLESKKVPDIYAKFKTELNAVPRPLTPQQAELGLLLINEVPGLRENESYWTHMDSATYNGKRYNRIKELLGKNEWDDNGNFNLLVFFLGEEKAGYARQAWKNIQYQMYQTGYSRRSFRSPANREMYLGNQIDFIIRLIPQVYTQQYNYNAGYSYTYSFYDLSIVEQIKYSHLSGDINTDLFRLWSAAIDMGNTAVFKQLEDIIFNKDPEGKITRNIIKALLNSEKQDAWVLVEKLLLAAQRQEGLRQTILEALDETSVGALKYMIRVIVDHQLTRFSSVVRAIGVWAGLGWETERETTVRNFLEKALLYLENPEAIPGGIESDNNADVYMALWAQGVYDVEQTLPYLQQLQQSAHTEKRSLALIFANQTAHYKITMPLYYAALDDPDLQPLACAIGFIYHTVNYSQNNKYYDDHYPELFNKLESVYRRVGVKEKTFESFIFSWIKVIFEKKEILKAMLCLILDKQERLDFVFSHFDDMDAEIRRQLSRAILPDHAAYNYAVSDKKEKTLTEFQRRYAMLILKDRSEFGVAFNALYNTAFTDSEMEAFPDLLKRKSADFRTKIITLLLRQKDAAIVPVINQLVLQGDVEQRLAGLDILLQLKKGNRLVKESADCIAAFRERKNISAKEEILLSQLTAEEQSIDFSAENGYGLFNPQHRSPLIPPAIGPSNIYEQLYAQNEFGFSMPVAGIKDAIAGLHALITQYKDHEYEVEYWNNTREKVLLGNVFTRGNVKIEFKTKEEEYNNYPLPEVWQEWYTKWHIQPVDLFLISMAISKDDSRFYVAVKKQLPLQSAFLPQSYKDLHGFRNPIFGICTALQLLHPFEQANEFLTGATTRLFASLGKDVLESKHKEQWYYYPRHDGWQGDRILNAFIDKINIQTLDDNQVAVCWNLFNWRQYSGLPEAITLSMPPLMIFCRAFQLQIIGEDEMYWGILTGDNVRVLSQKVLRKTEFDHLRAFPFLAPMFERLRNHLLDVELKRGDSSTPVTGFATALQAIYGINRFTEILAGLGKTTLHKGYIYSWGAQDKNKQESFSMLLKRCHPLETDTQALFNESMQRIKATETRLIEAAVYAPQWQKLVSGYLGWKGLDSAIWWMHAHTKTDAYTAQNAEAESEIARYSSIDIQEFKDGAVDKDWFQKAYKEIGKERWAIVYDAAKYISDGNGHRRARIYADVLLGVLTIKDVTEKIKTKRDQDYVRIYGLVPLNKTDSAKDVLARYEFIQQFKKESRQFGALKQTSEGLAIRVAMENLARNAGYPDPMRLTWAMETKQVQSILSKETQVQYDDVLIGLVIDEDGLADVVAFKDDKQLKAIPSKYKKDKKVEELNGHKKTLREQFRRSAKGLEDAMVRGDEFLLSEIKNLVAHPVISKHLEKLVFISGDKTAHGFYRDGHLVDADNKAYPLTEKDQLRIAHSTDLYEAGCWAGYQRYAFDEKLQQPFKQLFRELYLPTADELSERSVSRRYAGHQIQPKQTLALLKTRGWKVNYEEGLQKVFHKEGFAARMYAMADWFSPAEVESPTLETVAFNDLKTWTNIEFTTIHPRIFSEVMRDIDLVVSVAHAGGVDAEASHSSIEMRAVLLRETLRLFKINNVEIKGSHAIIKGKMGEYTVHLGSAVVHKMAAGYLSILPVHSQHRGRLFLPFVDDDPKSAEVLSKVLLLAKDDEIQDPTILRQLA